MKQLQRTRRRRSTGASAIALLLLVAVVAALAVGAANLVGCAMGVGDAPADDRSPTPNLSPTVTTGVQVYMISGEQLLPVERTVAAGGDVAIEAVRALLRGSTDQERDGAIDTAIPSGTRLESAAVQGSTAILAFNERFVADSSGASLPDDAQTEYYARLAQVTFTATATKEVSQVEVSAPGKQTLYLTRADFSGPASAASPAPTPTLSAGGTSAGSTDDPATTSAGPTAAGTSSPTGPTTSLSASPSPGDSPVAGSPAASSTPDAGGATASPAASATGSPTAVPSATASVSVKPTVGRRIDPRDAKAVQTKLVRLKYLPWKAVTGTFDYRTSQAVMAFQSWEGLTRDGVVGKQTVGRLVKAKPPAPTHKGKGRWVEVHRGKATVLVVQDGRTLRAVHTSTGQTGDDPPYDTPAGTFSIYAKQLKSWSVPYKVWMPYAMYFNGGIAMHGSDSVPPYPASHGCVRLPQVEASVVYGLVSDGSPVYVF